MPWGNKFPDMKNDPTYLDGRLSNAETSLAQKAQQADVLGRGINVKFPPTPLTACKGDGVTDDTVALQAILNAGYGKVFIPDGTYMINAVNTSGNNDIPNAGLSVPSNTTLELSPNAVLQAIANNSQTYSIIRVKDASKVIIRGGTLKGDRTTHTTASAWQPNTAYALNQQVNANGYILKCVTAGTSGTTPPVGTSGIITDNTVTWNYVYAGEWGYGLALNGVTNVSINDMTIQDCWGDGVFIGAGTGSSQSNNVLLNNVISTNNRRQGMSITHANGVNAINCAFNNTGGTAPQAGVDIEPSSSQSVKNINFVGCSFVGNTYASGLNINGSRPVSNIVVGDGCIFTNNTYGIGTSGSSFSDCKIGKVVATNNTKAGISIESGSIDVGIHSPICNNNGTNGIEITGGASKVNITGAETKGNTSYGIIFSGCSISSASSCVSESNGSEGIYVYASTDISISDCKCDYNTANGINVQNNSNKVTVTNCKTRYNQKNGILTQNTTDVQIHNNRSHSNSQVTNALYHNIYVSTCVDASIQGNISRKGTQTNFPGYGLYLSSNTRELTTNNDCYTGGTTGGIFDNSTSPLFGAGNKNNDGTFTTTPN